MKTYVKDDRVIIYELIRKPNKNAYFRVKQGVLVVTAHPRTTLHAIESFIDLKFDTFYQKIKESKSKEPDDNITLQNKVYQLVVTQGNFQYHKDETSVYVKSRSTDIEQIKRRIYALELQKMIEELMPEISIKLHEVGLTSIPMKIKYLTSKFGSYHKRHHEITMNSYLARLDLIYTKYVIFHEYAHILVFNHSKDFYNLLDKLMPNHKVYQKDLKKIAIQ
jgi:predicted metal-dependent hydrolase